MQSLTQKWLRQNILQYSQQDRVFADIDAALARFPNLRPKSDIYSSVSRFLYLFVDLISRSSLR